MAQNKEELISKVRGQNGGWKYLITNPTAWEKLGEDRFLRFLESCLTLKYDGVKAGTHLLPDDFKESKFQEEFYDIMRIVYGEHAVEILKERPNLTIANIPDIRVFEPRIYEHLGVDFINQTLNFDYDLVARGMSYNAIMQSILESDEDMAAFKYCMKIVSGDNVGDVYNYTKLFRTYSRYPELMKVCSQHHDTDMTLEQYSTLLDVVVLSNNLQVETLEDLDTFHERYAAQFDDIEYVYNETDIKERIVRRFFGLSMKAGINNNFTRSSINAVRILKTYGVAKIIDYEENLIKNGQPAHLDERELQTLKILNAITSYTSAEKSPSERAEVLRKMYYKLAENPNDIIRPGHLNEILNKIPAIYTESLRSQFTSLADLQILLDAGEPGITKQFRTYTTKDGVEHQIPVIRLEGVRYGGLITTLNANLSGYETQGHLADQWMGYEHGVSHISASMVTHDAQNAAYEITRGEMGSNSDLVSVLLPKEANIILMGSKDIFSTYESRYAEIYADGGTKFQFADELIGNTAKDTSDFNEIVVDRYTTSEDSYGGRIMPEAVFKYGEYISDYVLEETIVFTERLRAAGLLGPDEYLPIIQLNPEAYNTDEMRKELEERKDFASDMSKIADSVNVEGIVDGYLDGGVGALGE